MAKKKSDDLKDVHIPVTYMAVPRPWLITLLAVLTVMVLGVADIWFRAVSQTGVAAGDATPVTTTRSGKWGELTLVPIVISPPMELMFTNWGFMPRPTWFFPGANAGRVEQMLQSAGVSVAETKQLRTRARSESRISGVVLEPDPAWVRALTPETRARIYHMIAKSWLNKDQALAFRYPGTSLDAWLGSSLISTHTRQLVEPLIYRDGGYMLFSDVALVRAEIRSDDEFRRLGKALCRQPTVIARLSASRTANLETLVEYWGRGGRRTEIRPLIESIAANSTDRSVDVTNLLPPFARDHLYRYPELSAADLDRSAAENCLWTSLNFFNSNPNDRFLDGAVALRALKEDYFIVESDFELGDIVALLDEDGNIFHAVVFIAGNLVFSKNGMSRMTPWMLMSIDDVKGFYRWRSENPRLIVHRRKDF